MNKLRFLGILFILVFWSLISFFGLINELFLSNPFNTLKEIFVLFSEKEILVDILVTVSRVLTGFVFSMLIGIPFGIFFGYFKKIEAFTEPLVNLFRYTPASAIVPLSILWFGIGEMQKYFIVFFGTFPFIVLYVAYAVSSVEKKFINSAYLLGKNTRNIISKVIFPKSLPEIYEICRIELGGAWALVILAEIIVSTKGLGHRLILSQRFLQTETLFAQIIIIIAIGFGFDFILKKGYQKFFPWAEQNIVVK